MAPDLAAVNQELVKSFFMPKTDQALSRYAGALVVQTERPVNQMAATAQRVLAGINPTELDRGEVPDLRSANCWPVYGGANGE